MLLISAVLMPCNASPSATTFASGLFRLLILLKLSSRLNLKVL